MVWTLLHSFASPYLFQGFQRMLLSRHCCIRAVAICMASESFFYKCFLVTTSPRNLWILILPFNLVRDPMVTVSIIPQIFPLHFQFPLHQNYCTWRGTCYYGTRKINYLVQ